MSSCEIYAIRPSGDIEYYGAARNSFGGAMHIWMMLAEKYHIQADLFRGFDALWKAITRLDPPDRWVLGSTFDHVVVAKDQLPTLITHLRTFTATYPTETLRQEIALLETALADAQVTGVCFNQTSVNGDAWTGPPNPDDEDGGYLPYNVNREDDHWWMNPETLELSNAASPIDTP